MAQLSTLTPLTWTVDQRAVSRAGHLSSEWQSAMEQAQMRDWLSQRIVSTGRDERQAGSQSGDRPLGTATVTTPDTVAVGGATRIRAGSAETKNISKTFAPMRSTAEGMAGAVIELTSNSGAFVAPTHFWNTVLEGYQCMDAGASAADADCTNAERDVRLHKQRIHIESDVASGIRIWIRDLDLDEHAAQRLVHLLLTKAASARGTPVNLFLNGKPVAVLPKYVSLFHPLPLHQEP
jgi:hypothetical protein